MAQKSLLRRIITWPRLLYLALGFAAGAASASYVARPDVDETLSNGIAAYVTYRTGETPALIAASDCATRLGTEQEADEVTRVVTCTWDTATLTNIYEIGYNAAGKPVFIATDDKEKVSN